MFKTTIQLKVAEVKALLLEIEARDFTDDQVIHLTTDSGTITWGPVTEEDEYPETWSRVVPDDGLWHLLDDDITVCDYPTSYSLPGDDTVTLSSTIELPADEVCPICRAASEGGES